MKTAFEFTGDLDATYISSTAVELTFTITDAAVTSTITASIENKDALKTKMNTALAADASLSTFQISDMTAPVTVNEGKLPYSSSLFGTIIFPHPNYIRNFLST